MIAIHIHIEGIVQGVGFRPHVYCLAKQYSLSGWVNNNSDGVHVHLEGEKDKVDAFIKNLRHYPPRQAVVTNFTFREVSSEECTGFRITESEEETSPSVLLTPDYGTCPKCEEELFDTQNCRFRYPFTTCTNCGPRYSIISSLPYDRERTVMEPLAMCPSCEREFHDIKDRRYYSQTNSCEECGYRLSIHRAKEADIHEEKDELVQINDALKKGHIVGVKGLGGFLLLCDATNRKAIKTLRKRKKRPFKPLALMYPSVDLLAKDTHLSLTEKKWIQSPESPIVLLPLKEKLKTGIKIKLIAPGLHTIGAMRPCAPLLSLISHDFKKPLIATSGNVTGSPIIYDNQQAIESLLEIADLVAIHDRDIFIPEDDSVVRKARGSNKRIIIRRARGYAPNYFPPEKFLTSEEVLAMGSDLKGSFCLKMDENCYISQYLGDQSNFESQESYRNTLAHLSHVIQCKPSVVLTDLHPCYATVSSGEKTAGELGIEQRKIQHHQAHFAAVLGENKLLDTSDPILGVIWDGTGYGEDQQVWGGEFFSYLNYGFNRLDHFEYYPHLLGDKMPREPRLSALSLLKESPYLSSLENKFDKKDWRYYAKLIQSFEGPQTSSIGRLFDAVACVLGLGDVMTYEGQAAMLLESLAIKGMNTSQSFEPAHLLSSKAHLESVLIQLEHGANKEQIAWNFHFNLVKAIRYVAWRHNVKRIAFSGGVFQNALLIDLIDEHLSGDHELYFHQALSPNDENISFGQLMHFEIETRKRRNKIKNHSNASKQIVMKEECV